MKRLLIILFLNLYSDFVFAIEETSSKNVGMAVPGASVGILQWLLSCIGVIFLMFFLAYLLKKAKFVPGLKGNLLKIVAIVGVGSHEKIAIIKAGDRYFLIGITPQKITQLGEIDSSELNSENTSSTVTDCDETVKGNFAEKLFAFMVKGKNEVKSSPSNEQKTGTQSTIGENNENS